MNIDQDILAAALIGLELKKARLEEQIAAVKALTGAKAPKKTRMAAEDDRESPSTEKATKKSTKTKKKRVLSPEARERIAAAQKKRWAAHRGEV